MTPASILRGIRRRAATICCTHDVELTRRLAREIGELVSRETDQKLVITKELLARVENNVLPRQLPASDPVVKRDKPSCAECAQPVLARGLCSTHYSAARYAGRLQIHKPGQPWPPAPIAPVKPAAGRVAPWDTLRVSGFVDDPKAAAPEPRWAGLPPPTATLGTTEIH